jgi:hypothetical protein
MEVDSLVESMSNLRLPKMPETITFGRGTSYKGWFGNVRRAEVYNSNSGQTSQHKKSKNKSKEKESDNNDVQEAMEDVLELKI